MSDLVESGAENVVSMRSAKRKGKVRMAKRPKNLAAMNSDAEGSSRQAILEAAARIMATKGFSGASISAICKAAGCPASSLYWHFSSKENLFAEVVHWKADCFFSQFALGHDSNRSSKENIDEIAEQVGRSLQDDPLFLRFLLLLGLERQDMPDDVKKVIVEIRDSARRWWHAVLERQFSNRGPTVARLVADEYAEFGRSLIDGAFVARDFGDGPDLRKVFRQFMVLLNALNDKIENEEVIGAVSAEGKVDQ